MDQTKYGLGMIESQWIETFFIKVDHHDVKSFDKAKNKQFKCEFYSVNDFVNLDREDTQTSLGSVCFCYNDLIETGSKLIKHV